MALVAVPTHRIQTIHGAFGGPSFASITGAGGPSHLQTTFNSQPNVSYTNRARGAPLSILAARTAAASSSCSSAPQAPPTPVTTRQRRPSIRSVPIPMSTRHAPSPPAARSCPASADADAQDPFADSAAYTPTARTTSRFSSTSPTPKMVTLTYSSYTYPAVSTPRFSDENRTSKLVASVLLSRASGRPLRRRMPCVSEERTYVKSCLSKMVEVEC